MSIKIALVGAADKRAIVYPLLRLANILGHTELISDDHAYRRLLRDHSKIGDIGNVAVRIVEGTTDIESNTENRDPEVTVYAFTDIVPSDSTYVIRCNYTNDSMGDIQEAPETTLPSVAVKVELFGSKDKLSISLAESLEYIYSVEARKEIVQLKNRKLQRQLAFILKDPLGKTQKQITQLLARKDSWKQRRKKG